MGSPRRDGGPPMMADFSVRRLAHQLKGAAAGEAPDQMKPLIVGERALRLDPLHALRAFEPRDDSAPDGAGSPMRREPEER